PAPAAAAPCPPRSHPAGRGAGEGRSFGTKDSWGFLLTAKPPAGGGMGGRSVQGKEAAGVFAGVVQQLLHRDPLYLGQGLGGVGEETGVTPAAPMGLGGHVGTVGL